MEEIRIVIKNIINNKCNYMCDDLYNYIYEFVFDPIENVTLYYEVKLRNWDIDYRYMKLNWDQFIYGFIKCILHKKNKLDDVNIVPYLRSDISYFTNEEFYKNELKTFIKINPLNYLFYYEVIYNYINSYTTNTCINTDENYKMYSINYYNRGNSLNHSLVKV